MVFWNLLSDIISNVVGRDLTIMWTKITQPQMTLLKMVLLETCSSLTSLSKYEIEKPNDPNIYICHFFSTNVLLGSISLHMRKINNVYNWWGYIAIHAVLLLNLLFTLFCREIYFATIYALLCGEKLSPKIHLWRKNDKYQVWC